MVNNDMLDKLKTVFPEAITEKQVIDDNTGKISFEYALKEEFIDTLKDNFNLANDNQAYGLNFPGKKLAKLVASEPSYKTLKLKSGDGVNEDTTQNVYIEGDNLEVLKVLKNAYQGQIKMIYIDPPYNTGSDGFVYNDDFSETQLEYWKKLGYINEEGAKLVKENSENLKGYKHSGWLTFMYPRLKLARDLLRDDGVIFISIDDNEVHNLRLICDEIFGVDNFITVFSRLMKTGGAKGRFITPNVEYVLAYVKSIDSNICFKAPMSSEQIKNYYNKIETVGLRNGEVYGEERLYKASLDPRANQRYWIRCPDGSYVIPPGETLPDVLEQGEKVKPISGDGVWKWTFDRFLTELRSENIIFKNTKTSALVDHHGKKSKWNIYNKLWLNEQLEKGIVPANYIDKWENRESSAELKELIIPFEFAKPSNLVKYLIQLSQANENDLILDFFSGSATTAHAVMKLNAEDGGKRKYICVQIPEITKSESEASKAGYLNICEIGKERIRRSGAKILTEWKAKPSLEPDDLLTAEVQSSEDNLPDVGFKVFSLVDSPLYQDNGNIDDDSFTQDKLDNLNVDYAFNDILYHYILRVGVTLDKVVTSYQRDNFNYVITERKLLLLDNNLTQAIAEQIVSQHRQEIDKLYYTVNSLDVFTSYTEIDGIAKRHNLPCEVL